MYLNAPLVIALFSLLIALIAIYNAYLLRGGALAWTQIFMALGMLSLVLSQVWVNIVPGSQAAGGFTIPDGLFILGFVFLLLTSLKLRLSLK